MPSQALGDNALRNVAIGFEPHQDGSFNRIYSGGGTVLSQGRIVGDMLEGMSSMVLASITGASRRAEAMRLLAAV